MTFKTLEEAEKFYKDYPKLDVGIWIISKVVLNHSHPCCPDRIEMLKQHNELSMLVRRTIENNEKAEIRPNKIYQSLIAVVGGHHELIWCWSLSRSPLLDRDEKQQRSESMHNFLNKFITHNSSRAKKERELFDAADFYTVILCATKSPIEAQFQHVYTHEKFRKVQVQFRGKVNCITRSTKFALGFMAFEVVEQVSNSTFNKFVVTYDAISREIKCQIRTSKTYQSFIAAVGDHRKLSFIEKDVRNYITREVQNILGWETLRGLVDSTEGLMLLSLMEVHILELEV
ncbi:hypothetical protein Ahy_B04g069078 [Arachis hypogaea]|uniref:Protein FAR1-RELATED SEQUENCE n=1 Tax=Arachis hypogaea TaxID=3818 RepID=A0A444ZBK5_ARAHY|nr:hypothetical protein Ahy_B04g069078 [Arachis hypogaea]